MSDANEGTGMGRIGEGSGEIESLPEGRALHEYVARPVCEGCNRPMPLTDDESRELQAREFREFEDVIFPNGKGRPTPSPSGSSPNARNEGGS